MVDDWILRKQDAIKQMIEVCKKKIGELELQGRKEEIVSETFLLTEYESMLEEFEQYYSL